MGDRVQADGGGCGDTPVNRGSGLLGPPLSAAVALGLRADAVAQFLERLFNQSVGPDAGKESETEVYRKGIYPCRRRAIQKNLLPDIKRVAQSTQLCDGRKVQNPPYPIMATVNHAMNQNCEEDIDDG